METLYYTVDLTL